MPVSHSHQLLWVSFRPPSRVTRTGLAGSATFQNLVRLAAERAQHVDRGAVASGQRLAVADPHHLRAAGLVFALLARDMAKIFRLRRIGHVDDGGAVGLGLPGLRIDRDRNIVGAAVVADIGNPALALVMNRRLIGATRLQIAGPDQLHVGRFGRCADHLALGPGTAGADHASHPKKRQLEPTGHDFSIPYPGQSSLAD